MHKVATYVEGLGNHTNIQGRHGEFEPDKAQYSTPNLLQKWIESQKIMKGF